MNDTEVPQESAQEGISEIRSMPRKKFPLRAQFSILGAFVLVAGLSVAVIGAQQQQDQRSEASATYYTNYQATSPLLNETWKQGTSHVIRWKPGTSGKPINIWLLDVRRYVVYGKIVGSISDTGSYTWTIPTSIPNAQYQIYIDCTVCSTELYGYGKNFYLSGGYAAPTKVPTKAPTPKPTVVVPTAIPTSVPTVLPTTVPTGSPTQEPTVIPGVTTLSLTLALHGIGNGGDVLNPASQGNMSPQNPQREVTVDVYDNQNQLVKAVESSIEYDETSGLFTGLVDLGTAFQTGIYTVKIKSPDYLRALVPGIQTITSGAQKALPKTALISGDINDDNKIDILDYNILAGCYSDLLPATNCTDENAYRADLTDDGAVNQFDYNFFLRELSTRQGE